MLIKGATGYLHSFDCVYENNAAMGCGITKQLLQVNCSIQGAESFIRTLQNFMQSFRQTFHKNPLSFIMLYEQLQWSDEYHLYGTHSYFICVFISTLDYFCIQEMHDKKIGKYIPAKLYVYIPWYAPKWNGQLKYIQNINGCNSMAATNIIRCKYTYIFSCSDILCHISKEYFMKMTKHINTMQM